MRARVGLRTLYQMHHEAHEAEDRKQTRRIQERLVGSISSCCPSQTDRTAMRTVGPVLGPTRPDRSLADVYVFPETRSPRSECHCAPLDVCGPQPPPSRHQIRTQNLTVEFHATVLPTSASGPPRWRENAPRQRECAGVRQSRPECASPPSGLLLHMAPREPSAS